MVLDSFLVMLKVQVALVIYLSIGIFVRKKGIVSAQSRKDFIDFVMMVTMPCMVFNSFDQDFGISQLRLASDILAISLSACVFSILLGKIIYNRYPHSKKSIMQYGTLISNSVFAGMPIVESAYGSLGLFYASIFIIPSRIFMWSAGISLFTTSDLKTKLKQVLLNPPMIAVFLGIARMLFAIKIPQSVNSAIVNIGNCTTAMSMIIIGMVLADIPVKSIFEKGVFYLSGVRLLVIPVVLLIALRILHIDHTITSVAVIILAMPVGTTATMLAKIYGGDYEFASKCVLVSTVLSFLTLPLVTLFT